MGSSNHGGAGELCLEAEAGGGGGGRSAGRKKAAAAAEQKSAARQPQRGLGVAQLEKIRMRNHIMAAYHRSGMPPPPPAMASTFQPYLAVSQECFEAMDRRIADARYSQYYAAENLLPYTSPATQPISFGHAGGAIKGAGYSPPPSQYCWMSSSTMLHDAAAGATGRSSSTEELDLELRL